ncbi:MAG: hypothetical protein HC897_06190 [Thermoanaerobaculia bacterium]|nr:hypothetical protein [Thermoanaerobaculia bacterium]
MQELVELRVREEKAEEHLPAGLGVDIGYGVRKVTIPTDGDIFRKINQIDRAFRAEAKYFFSGWQYHRKYNRRELENAELFQVWAKRAFEPAGEECGTEYDDSSACKHVFSPSSEFMVSGHRIQSPAVTCGVGARQITPLFLNSRTIPRKVDFARTIANELIVSARTVSVFQENGLTGACFDPVRLANKGGRASEDHQQLTVAAPFVEADPRTRFGEDPFDEGAYGRCPFGHIPGLNVLSELTVTRASVTAADVMATKQMVGSRGGLIRPRPLLLMSPRAWRAIQAAKLKGFGFEVAYIAP